MLKFCLFSVWRRIKISFSGFDKWDRSVLADAIRFHRSAATTLFCNDLLLLFFWHALFFLDAVNQFSHSVPLAFLHPFPTLSNWKHVMWKNHVIWHSAAKPGKTRLKRKKYNKSKNNPQIHKFICVFKLWVFLVHENSTCRSGIYWTRRSNVKLTETQKRNLSVNCSNCLKDLNLWRRRQFLQEKKQPPLRTAKRQHFFFFFVKHFLQSSRNPTLSPDQKISFLLLHARLLRV